LPGFPESALIGEDQRSNGNKLTLNLKQRRPLRHRQHTNPNYHRTIFRSSNG